VPLATVTLVVKGGASTDPAGRAGTASFVADLATKGTRTRTAAQIAEQLESLGAEISSGAGADGSILSVRHRWRTSTRRRRSSPTSSERHLPGR
jgi:zinc protease